MTENNNGSEKDPKGGDMMAEGHGRPGTVLGRHGSKNTSNFCPF